jgi:hypothetical protein
MTCDRCKKTINDGETMMHNGQALCEDCYIDALSPVKACDPWAVHCAKSFVEKNASHGTMSETQSKILRILKETGGTEPKIMAERLHMTLPDLEREIATLRHMEKLRAELRDGRKVIRLW